MKSISLFSVLAALGAAHPASSSASMIPSGTLNCQQNIPTNGPTPSEVANALTKNNQVNTICSAQFNGSGDSTHETFNLGLLNIALTRPSANQPLQFCQQAINKIIGVCILGSFDFGGTWNLNGEVYNITNVGFPKNPLIPGADNGATSTAWSNAQCTQSALANAAADPSKRWAAADANGAWNAAIAAWNNGQPADGNIALPFSESISNFFHGPESWNCQDIGDIPCSGAVQCSDTNHPAGSVIIYNTGDSTANSGIKTAFLF